MDIGVLADVAVLEVMGTVDVFDVVTGIDVDDGGDDVVDDCDVLNWVVKGGDVVDCLDDVMVDIVDDWTIEGCVVITCAAEKLIYHNKTKVLIRSSVYIIRVFPGHFKTTSLFKSSLS